MACLPPHTPKRKVGSGEGAAGEYFSRPRAAPAKAKKERGGKYPGGTEKRINVPLKGKAESSTNLNERQQEGREEGQGELGGSQQKRGGAGSKKRSWCRVGS